MKIYQADSLSVQVLMKNEWHIQREQIPQIFLVFFGLLIPC